MQLFAITCDAFAEDLQRLVRAVESDGTLLQQSFGIFHQCRMIAVELAHFFFTAEDLVRRRELFRRQHAHQRVLRHGAQQAVRVVVALVAKSDGQQCDEVLRPFRPRTERKPREFGRLDTDALIRFQHARRCVEGQDEKGIRKFQWFFRQRFAIEQVRTQQLIQLLKAVVVLGQADVE